MSCDADIKANSLLDSLTIGENFAIPDVDLNDPAFAMPDTDISGSVTPLSNEQLTQQMVGGTGTYDVIMGGHTAHLRFEYDAGRITQAEYSKVFASLAESSMGQAVQFLVSRDQAYWAAIGAQLQAITARVQLQTAKAQMVIARIEAKTQKANFALTKLKLAAEDEGYCALKEQVEGLRAQTLDTRRDSTPVAGSVGKQKDLYSQQIESYKRSSEVNAAKIFYDAYAIQKSIDEGTTTPDSLEEASIENVLMKLKASHGFIP